MDLKVVTGHKFVPAGKLETDRNFSARCLSGQNTINVLAVGHAGIPGLVVVPLQLPSALLTAEVISKGQVLGQIDHLLTLVIDHNVCGSGALQQPVIHVLRQSNIEPRLRQAIRGFAYFVSAAVDHTVIAIAAGVDGNVGRADGDGAGRHRSIAVLGPYSVQSRILLHLDLVIIQQHSILLDRPPLKAIPFSRGCSSYSCILVILIICGIRWHVRD